MFYKILIPEVWQNRLAENHFLNSAHDVVFRDCAIIIRRGGGGEKLELSSKNLRYPPLQNKEISSNPPLLCQN